MTRDRHDTCPASNSRDETAHNAALCGAYTSTDRDSRAGGGLRRVRVLRGGVNKAKLLPR